MPTGVSFASAEGSSRSQRASSHSASSTGMATPTTFMPCDAIFAKVGERFNPALHRNATFFPARMDFLASAAARHSTSMSASYHGLEDEDEPDMKWACEITAMRLLKKAKKEHLIPLLEDFGVPTKGSKEELSTLLSEQLHYETDSGDDE